MRSPSLRPDPRIGLTRFLWGVLTGILATAATAQTTPSSPASTAPASATLKGTEPDAGFGRALAAAGDINGDGFDDLLIGSPTASNRCGVVALHLGSASGVRPTPDWFSVGSVPDENFGINVAGVGDINRDGFDDFIVSRFDLSRSNVVATLLDLYLGSKDGPQPTGWRYRFEHPGFYLGGRAGRAGDVNGDGIDDFFIGPSMLRFVPVPDASGTVVVFHGSTNGPANLPDWTVKGPLKSDGFGASVAGAGDVNQDGFDDLIVGAPLDDQAGHDSGRIHVFHGSPTGLSPTPNSSRHSPLTARDRFSSDQDAYFGCSVAGAGDVNGDGYADVIVGCNFGERDDVNEGFAAVFLGSPTGLRMEHHWIGEPDNPFANFGSSVAGAGDVNRDGFADVIVGAPMATEDQLQEGLVALYPGSRSGLRRNPAWTGEADRTEDHLGEIVIGAGDLNGDGFSDVAMSAPNFRDGGVMGLVRIQYGSPSGLRGSSEWRLTKPWTASAQLWWDRTSTPKRFGAAFATFTASLLIIGSAVLWHRRTASARDLRAFRAGLQAAARDLHDEVGPHLTTLGALTASTGVADELPIAAPNRLHQAIRDLGETLDWLTWRWKSGGTDLRATVETLFATAQAPARASGLQVLTEIGELKALGELTPAIQQELQPCLREAVNNVVRHAAASSVVLRAEMSSSTNLRLEIEDDGRGLNRDVGRPGQDGLGNLTARLSRIGGRVDVASEPGRGVLVIFDVPLKTENNQSKH